MILASWLLHECSIHPHFSSVWSSNKPQQINLLHILLPKLEEHKVTRTCTVNILKPSCGAENNWHIYRHAVSHIIHIRALHLNCSETRVFPFFKWFCQWQKCPDAVTSVRTASCCYGSVVHNWHSCWRISCCCIVMGDFSWCSVFLKCWADSLKTTGSAH